MKTQPEFLRITRRKRDGLMTFQPMDAEALERTSPEFELTHEVFGVPILEVLALAGSHDDSGPMRMMQPMTVDQVALRITAALFVNSNEMTAGDCVAMAWDAAELFMIEAMQRDAMGVPLKSDETDEGETEDGQENGQEKNGEGDEKEKGQGAEGDAGRNGEGNGTAHDS